ncbi:MAG: alpha/beta fold hydrolase [Acidimicrobiaceae bacterium]|nr:alpha/beta fold hydrolase [Acidimicrobiaceae bacterium]MYE98262.1 alpha/beta fold hydrolase [Acidimicrobiaceae bacterium]MYI53066.1 alpha/beta fold hydrolase [Acidimicrobiaceae bacterium]
MPMSGPHATGESVRSHPARSVGGARTGRMSAPGSAEVRCDLSIRGGLAAADGRCPRRDQLRYVATVPDPSDAPGDATPTDVDGPLAWREQGAGDAVLFLHGLGGSRTSWEPQLARLSDAFRCIAWDMPGYGASAPVEVLNFTAIADAVARLLDAVAVERAHLVGESFGGMQAIHAALRHPDRVDRLVLANTSPAFGLDGTDPDMWRTARLAPLDAGLTPADIAEDVLTAVAGSDLGPDLLAMRVAGFARIPADALRAAVECLPSHNVLDRLAEIAAPALVIAGELDAETPVAYSRILAHRLPNAELVVLNGVGHLAVSEASRAFNGLVRRFLVPEALHHADRK